jgi:hypothetical protein
MKNIFLVSGVIITLVSCQIKNDPLNDSGDTASHENKYEINIAGKKGGDAEVLWQISMKDDRLNYSDKEGSYEVMLSEDDTDDINDLLESCQAKKIKTKPVAKNKHNEWLSVVIINKEMSVRCAESFNYKLTKKSRKRLKPIKNHLLQLIKSRKKPFSDNLVLNR